MRSPGIMAGLFLVIQTAAASAAPMLFGASKDNTLYQSATGALSDGKGPHLYVGRTNQGTAVSLRRGLIAFDLSTIPTNAVVSSVTLTMNMSKGFGGTIELHRASKNWGEGTSNAGDPGGGGANSTPSDATWLHTFFNSSLWTTPGGDFSSTATASFPLDTARTYQFSNPNLVPDVQSWVSNPSGNFGWLIKGDEGNPGSAVRFDTREIGSTSFRPSLSVTFTVPEPGAAATLGSLLVAGSGRRRRA
jgi:hypothetical protein